MVHRDQTRYIFLMKEFIVIDFTLYFVGSCPQFFSEYSQFEPSTLSGS